MTVALLIFSASFAGLVFDGLSVFHKGFAVREGILGSVLPGVIQFSSGIGREVPAGGLWTTTAVFSFALAAVGAALSPSFAFLGLTMKSRAGFALSQVWIVSGLAAGALLLLGPIVAGEMGAARLFHDARARFAAYDQLAAACVIVMLVAMLLIAVAFFAASGASIVTIELLHRYVAARLDSRAGNGLPHASRSQSFTRRSCCSPPSSRLSRQCFRRSPCRCPLSSFLPISAFVGFRG